MNLQGGVLAIGSLYWEDEKNCIQKPVPIRLAEYRRKWRLENFKIEPIDISVPIRYGRKSGSREDTYTMVFSNELSVDDYGTGKLLEYKLKTQAFEDLEFQAVALALAEGIFKDNNRRIATSWGAVALILNPNLKVEKKSTFEYISYKWQEIYSEFSATLKPRRYKIDDERPSIDSDGFLNIGKVNFPDNIDYLFATPVEINIKSYPSTKRIAKMINESGYGTYFIQNKQNGISTKDDSEIINQLSEVYKKQIGPTHIDPIDEEE